MRDTPLPNCCLLLWPQSNVLVLTCFYHPPRLLYIKLVNQIFSKDPVIFLILPLQQNNTCLHIHRHCRTCKNSCSRILPMELKLYRLRMVMCSWARKHAVRWPYDHLPKVKPHKIMLAVSLRYRLFYKSSNFCFTTYKMLHQWYPNRFVTLMVDQCQCMDPKCDHCMPHQCKVYVHVYVLCSKCCICFLRCEFMVPKNHLHRSMKGRFGMRIRLWPMIPNLYFSRVRISFHRIHL